MIVSKIIRAILNVSEEKTLDRHRVLITW